MIIRSPNKYQLAIDVEQIIGVRPTTATLSEWEAAGAPMALTDGVYDTSAIVRWLYQRSAASSEDTWTNQMAREVTFQLEDQRKLETGHLWTIASAVELIQPLALEMRSQFGQLQFELQSFSKDRSVTREAARDCCNDSLGRVSRVLQEQAAVFRKDTPESALAESTPVDSIMSNTDSEEPQSTDAGTTQETVVVTKRKRPDFLN